jgi:hypothetical protein
LPSPRTRLGLLARGLAVALLASALAGMAGAAGPAPEKARIYQARALHRMGSCEPLPPNSPGGDGVRSENGARIYQSSAHHPFEVGFYGFWGSGGEAWVRVDAAGGPADRLWVPVPLTPACPD